MQDTISWPKSFPNARETEFLKLIFCKDADFKRLFKQWEETIIFDDIDYATLRLLPLLYLKMQRLGQESIYKGKMQGIYRKAWVKNQLLFREAASVAALLQKHDIPVVAFKGLPLLVDAYKNIGSRFLADADFFIDSVHTKKAIRVMQTNGWKLQNPHFPDVEYFTVESLSRIVNQAHFVNDRSVEIDIHWQLFPFLSYRLKEEVMPFREIEQHSIPFEFNGVQYKALSPKDALMQIIVHGAEYNAHRPLRWVADAVAIISRYPIDWDEFIATTHARKFVPEISYAFSYLLLHEFIAIPSSAAQAILKMKSEDVDAKEYWLKANSFPISFRLLGSFPRLWNIYWHYEAKPIFPISFYYFAQYLSRAWGLPHTRELLPFIFYKTNTRAAYYLKKYLGN